MAEFFTSAGAVLKDIAYIIIYIAIIYYFANDRKHPSFVRVSFIAVGILSVLTELILSLSLSLKWDLFYSLLVDYNLFDAVYSPLAFIRFFILIFGLTFFVGKGYDDQNSKEEFPKLVGKRRNAGLILFLFIITFGIYFFFWLYKTVKELRNNFGEDVPLSPGWAVGGLFIPIFNIGWIFYMTFTLMKSIVRIEEKYYGKAAGFHFHPILTGVLIIIFLIVSQLQWRTELLYDKIGSWIFIEVVIFYLWVTVQAKINAFYDISPDANSDMSGVQPTGTAG